MSTNKDDRYKYDLKGLYNHAVPDEAVAQNHVFSNEELFCLKLIYVYAYFDDLAYGTPTPLVDNSPTKSRRSTLEFAKTAISSFHPN